MADGVKCWLCGENVKPETRYIKCKHCQGHIVSPDPEKYKNGHKVDITFDEAKRLMEEQDTYERKHGRVRTKRHAVR